MTVGWKASTAWRAWLEVTVLHLLSPDETNPALDGDFKLVDSENGAAVDVTADYEMIQRYRQSLLDWRESWRRFCTARGIHYAPVDTSLPLEELLFAWMRQQGVLR